MDKDKNANSGGRSEDTNSNSNKMTADTTRKTRRLSNMTEKKADNEAQKPKINASTMTLYPSPRTVETPQDKLVRKAESQTRLFGARGPVTQWKSLTTMPKEISQYAIDQAIWADAKETDMERHQQDEKLDDFQRAILCLGAEDVSQKGFCAQCLPDLAQLNTERTFNEIFPMIERELKNTADLTFHTLVAGSIVPLFKALMKSKSFKRIQQLVVFLGVTIDNKNTDIASTWLNAMEDIIELMSPKDSMGMILPMAIAKGVKKSSVIQKNAAIALMKKLIRHCGRFPEGQKLYQPAMNMVKELQNDANAAVRAACSLLLSDIIKIADAGVRPEITRNLLKMAEDKESIVKSAVTENLSRLVLESKMDVPTMKAIIAALKIIAKAAYSAVPPDVKPLVHFSKYIGGIAKAAAVKNVLTPDDNYWFLDAYFQLCQFDLPSDFKLPEELPPGFLAYKNALGNKLTTATLLSTGAPKIVKAPTTSKKRPSAPDTVQDTKLVEEESWMIRANCVSNFPDLLEFGKPLVNFRNGLQRIMHNFYIDPHPLVRKNAAACLYPVMEKVQDQCVLCKDDFIRILADDSVDVVEQIVPNISNILKLFVTYKVLSPENLSSNTSAIGNALLFCEERLSQTTDWRIHSSLLLQLGVLPFCMPSDYLYQHFMPIIFHRLLHLKQLPSRLGATEALISLLRHNRRAIQRDEIRRKIKAFAHSTHAQDRMLYLYMNDIIMNRFSKKYYRDNFFETTLTLAEDVIPNVRTKTYRQMPKMKERILSMKDERQLQAKLDAVIQKIQASETDRDALEAIKVALDEMSKMANMQKYMSPSFKIILQKQEEEDNKREKEEQFIASFESKMSKYTGRKLSLPDKPEQSRKMTLMLKEQSAPAPGGQQVPKISIASAPGTGTTDDKLPGTAIRKHTDHYKNTKNIVPLAKKEMALDANSSQTTITTAHEEALAKRNLQAPPKKHPPKK